MLPLCRSSIKELQVSTIGSQKASIPPETWERREMRSALASREISTVYRLLRRQGVTQRQIAAMTGQSQSEVSEILKGRQVMAYDVLARIADGLGAPRGYLGLAYDDVQAWRARDPDDEEEEVRRRKFLAHAAAVAVGANVLGSDEMPGSAGVLWTPSRTRTQDPGDTALAATRRPEEQEWIRFLDDLDVLEILPTHPGSSTHTRPTPPALSKALEAYCGELEAARRSTERPTFDSFFVSHFIRLVRHLMPLCHGDHHLAEDVAQEAFLQAYRNWKQLRNPERAYAWLGTIAVRLCWKWLDKCKEQTQVSREVAALSPCVVSSPDANVTLDIARAVEKLPPRERAVARLTLILEMTPAEIATAVGSTPGTVRAQLHAARQKLKALLDPASNRERPAT